MDIHIPNSGNPKPQCGHCGGYHDHECPRIKRIEYHENGTIKEIEYHDPKSPPITYIG